MSLSDVPSTTSSTSPSPSPSPATTDVPAPRVKRTDRKPPGRKPMSPEQRVVRDAALKARREQRRIALARIAREALQARRTPAKVDLEREPDRLSEIVPTPEQRQQVQTMAGLGMRQDEIALIVINPHTGKHIDEKTLRKHFEEQLLAGPVMANSNVAKSLYNKAVGTGPQAVTAAMFWAKVRMGWKEHLAVDVEIKAGVLVPPPQVSPEAWIAAQAVENVAKLPPGSPDQAKAS